jgi:hypothetical protein
MRHKPLTKYTIICCWQSFTNGERKGEIEREITKIYQTSSSTRPTTAFNNISFVKNNISSYTKKIILTHSKIHITKSFRMVLLRNPIS